MSRLRASRRVLTVLHADRPGVTLYTRVLSYLRPHLAALAAAGAATFAFAALDASAYVLLIPFVDALFRAGPSAGTGAASPEGGFPVPSQGLDASPLAGEAGGPDPMTRLLDATVYRIVDVQGDPLQAVRASSFSSWSCF